MDRRWSIAFPLHRAHRNSAATWIPASPWSTLAFRYWRGRMAPRWTVPSRRAIPMTDEEAHGRAVPPRDVRADPLDWQRTVGVAVQDVAGEPCAEMVSALVVAPVLRTSMAGWPSRLAPASTRAAQGEATSIIKSGGLPRSETMWPTLASGQPVRLSLKHRRPARRLLPGQLRRRPRSPAGPGPPARAVRHQQRN